jgi:fibronectin-binding autotransporter adhesin
MKIPSIPRRERRAFSVKARCLVLVLAGVALSNSFAGSQKIRSENDDWWTEQAAIFFPQYQFTLTSMSPVFAALGADALDLSAPSGAPTPLMGAAKDFGTGTDLNLGLQPSATSLFWDTANASGLQGGSGTWSTAVTNWNTVINPGGNGRVVWAQNSDAFFETSGPAPITVSGTVNVNSITFDGTGYNVSSGALTLTGAGGNITANQNATITSVIGGSVGLTKLGAAVLTVDASQTFYTGNTTINAGTLATFVGDFFGPSGSTIFINAGTLRYDATYTGATKNTITVGSASSTIDVSGANTYSPGVISGSGSLTKNGTGGTLSLDFTNTFTGGFTANSGTTDLNVNGALGSVSSVTVGTGTLVESPGTGTTNVINDSAGVTLNGTLDLSGGTETVASLAGTSSTASLIIGDFSGTPGSFTVGDSTFTGFAGVISGSRATSGAILTKQGSGGLILSNVNTYSGDTFINAGFLIFASGGSANNSTMRLGNTIANSPAVTLSLSAASGGNLIASPLEVRASASGTQGTRVLTSLATSGTNQYSGAITMNADLTLQSATGGTLLLQGGSLNVGTKVLSENSNLDNNGADTLSIQGTVKINELMSSSTATGGSLVKDGSGTLIIQSTGNNYTGTSASALNANGTRIAGGVLGIFGDTSLGLAPTTATNNIFFTNSSLTSPPTTRTLQDTSGNVTIAATRNINVATGVTGTFDSNGNIFTINSVINGTGGNIAKIGAGSLVLNGANTFTGTTTVNAGTLNAAVTNALGSTTGITVNTGGTLLLSNSGTNNRINDSAPMTLNAQGSATVAFNTGGLSEHGATNNTAGIGALTLQSSSIIDMGNIASIIAFANSAAQSPNWSGTLSIYNWSGIPVTGNGTDQLFFGNNPAGLLASQLADFQFYTGAGTGAFAPGAAILSTGEVVPLSAVPEPSTLAAGFLAVAAVAYSQRRRLRWLVRAAEAA